MIRVDHALVGLVWRSLWLWLRLALRPLWSPFGGEACPLDFRDVGVDELRGALVEVGLWFSSRFFSEVFSRVCPPKLGEIMSKLSSPWVVCVVGPVGAHAAKHCCNRVVVELGVLRPGLVPPQPSIKELAVKRASARALLQLSGARRLHVLGPLLCHPSADDRQVSVHAPHAACEARLLQAGPAYQRRPPARQAPR